MTKNPDNLDSPDPKTKTNKLKTKDYHLSKSRIYAEFNSSQLDLESMRRLLDSCDVMRIRNTMHDVRAIRPFYSLINTLYFSYLRTWLSEAERKNSDKALSNIEKLVYVNSTAVNPIVYPMLNNFYAFLIKVRTMQGLGIAFRRDQSLQRQIERGLNIDKGGKNPANKGL